MNYWVPARCQLSCYTLSSHWRTNNSRDSCFHKADGLKKIELSNICSNKYIIMDRFADLEETSPLSSLKNSLLDKNFDMTDNLGGDFRERSEEIENWDKKLRKANKAYGKEWSSAVGILSSALQRSWDCPEYSWELSAPMSHWRGRAVVHPQVQACPVWVRRAPTCRETSGRKLKETVLDNSWGKGIWQHHNTILASSVPTSRSHKKISWWKTFQMSWGLKEKWTCFLWQQGQSLSLLTRRDSVSPNESCQCGESVLSWDWRVERERSEKSCELIRTVL